MYAGKDVCQSLDSAHFLQSRAPASTNVAGAHARLGTPKS